MNEMKEETKVVAIHDAPCSCDFYGARVSERGGPRLVTSAIRLQGRSDLTLN